MYWCPLSPEILNFMLRLWSYTYYLYYIHFRPVKATKVARAGRIPRYQGLQMNKPVLKPVTPSKFFWFFSLSCCFHKVSLWTIKNKRQYFENNLLQTSRNSTRHILKRWSQLTPMSSERQSRWTLTEVQLKNRRYAKATKQSFLTLITLNVISVNIMFLFVI